MIVLKPMKFTARYSFTMIRVIIILSVITVSFNSCSSGQDIVTFGIIADVHQDLQKDARERLHVFLTEARERTPDFVVQLGDLSHGTTIDSILEVWNNYPGERYHVLGNHDSDNLLKDSVVAKQNMPGNYYSYDKGGVHFIVLDLNYIFADGEYKDFGLGNNYRIPSENKNLISPEQMEWLKRDIAHTTKPVIVFSHQAIGELWDGEATPSREAIRAVFENHNREKKNKVIACFAGDQHTDCHEVINGIHYFQINSSSYYWIGENNVFSSGNMAEYKDPLYAFVTVDLKSQTIEVEGTRSEFLPPAPTDETYSKMYKASPNITSRKVKF